MDFSEIQQTCQDLGLEMAEVHSKADFDHLANFSKGKFISKYIMASDRNLQSSNAELSHRNSRASGQKLGNWPKGRCH